MVQGKEGMLSAKEELFRQVREELSAEPRGTVVTRDLLREFVRGLCRFVPSRGDLHAAISRDLVVEGDLTSERAFTIMRGLARWVKHFQAPVHDEKVDAMLARVEREGGTVHGICAFLEEYYDHVELCYRETWEARARLANGESAVPPERRVVVKGENGVPTTIRSGR